jgi:hypothetical protein
MRRLRIYVVLTILVAAAALVLGADENALAEGPSLAVGPQYDSTHVYVTPEDLDLFTTSLVETFGGAKTQSVVLTVTPTPSETAFEFVLTPVGTFSVFGFKSPIPYPFGMERTGYLVSDFDAAIDSAKANHADIVVAPFQDPIGRDAIIAWPGGVHMQPYWHTTAPLVPVASALDRLPAIRRASDGRRRAAVTLDVSPTGCVGKSDSRCEGHCGCEKQQTHDDLFG